MNRGNIFLDLDGTLISCRQRQTAVLKEVLGVLELPAVDEARFWRLKRQGHTTRSALEALRVSTQLAEKVAFAWAEMIEHPCWLEYDRVLPGAMAALQALAHAGFRIQLLTARKSRGSLEAQLSKLEIRERFAEIHVVDPANTMAEKARILASSAALGFVGDTEHDARAARLGGIPFAAVSSGQRNAAFLRSAGIDPIYQRVDQAASRWTAVQTVPE